MEIGVRKMTKTIKELLELDEKRTRFAGCGGKWLVGNNRVDVHTCKGFEEVCTAFHESNANFIAQAPRMAQILRKLDKFDIGNLNFQERAANLLKEQGGTWEEALLDQLIQEIQK